MKITLLISILLLFLFIPIISSSIVDGNCPVGETCIFSMYKMNNSHAGQAGFFNYSVCYPESINITLREGNCNTGENFILSFFKPNNTHISSSQGFYNYSICVQGTNCSMDTVRDYAIVTLYRLNNTHVGDISYFNYTLYCGNITPVVTPPSGGGGISTPKLPEIIIERVPEIVVEAAEIVKEVPWYLWFLVVFLFLLGWRRKGKYRSLKRKVKAQEKQKKQKGL